MTSVANAFVGCKVSQADGEEALAALAAAGLRPVSAREAADVVVVHTCCVTAEAERKSRRLVRRVAGEGRRVIVAGCAAAPDDKRVPLDDRRGSDFADETAVLDAPILWIAVPAGEGLAVEDRGKAGLG